MSLTKNFNIDEFACRDGSPVPDAHLEDVSLLAEQLQIIRDHLGLPVIVISGYRSPEYNKKIGGVKRSQHMLSKAADIVVPGVESVEVWRTIKKLIADGSILKGGLGLYETFVHYDIRGRNARWYGKGMKKYKN